MIGGFLGGLANAGRVVQGADEAQGEALQRALIALRLRQAREQDQAQSAAYQALPGLGQGGGIPGGGLPQGGLPQGGLPQGTPPYQPGQVRRQPSPPVGLPPQRAGFPGGPQAGVPMGGLPNVAMDWTPPPGAPPRPESMRQTLEEAGPPPPLKQVASDAPFPTQGGGAPQVHPAVRREIQQTGMAAIQAKLPPEAVRASSGAAVGAASGLDPTKFGSYGLPDLARAVEETSPSLPPAVKYLAVAQLHKLMAPDQQQMFKLLMQQQKNELAAFFKDREFDIRERNLNEREQHDRAMERRPTAADRPSYIPFQTPEGTIAFETHSGTVKGVSGMEGATRIGTGAKNMGRWSDDAMEALVRQGMSGDPTILQKLPRSGPARQQYEETLAATMKGMEGGIAGGTSTMMMNQMRMAEARSAAHTAGRVTMNTELFSREAVGAGQQVVETSKLFPRTEIPLVNAALAAYEQNTGDPNVIKFGAAIFSLLNAYGKMSNPTGTGIHDVDKQRLADILDRRATQGQVEAAVQQIITEGKVVSDAAFHAQEDVLKRIVPGAGGQPPASPAGASGLSPTKSGPPYKAGDTVTIEGKQYRVTGGDPTDPDIELIK